MERNGEISWGRHMSPNTHDWERIRKYIKDAENKMRQEFLEVLRSLHDYTFINVTDANKIIYLRDNIENELKKYVAMARL